MSFGGAPGRRAAGAVARNFGHCTRAARFGAGIALLNILIATAAWGAGFEMFSTSSASTGEKPQSKIWYHDGSYWGVFKGPNGVAVYQNVGTSWVRGPVLIASGNADVKWNGTTLYVLVYAGTPKLFELSYNPGSRTWSVLPNFPVNVPNPSGSETMVLEQDSTGRLWATAEGGGSINVYCTTTADHRTWSSAFVLQSGVNSDDISAVVAFGGDKIGVFWSDQNRWNFGFRVHHDSASPTSWDPQETIFAGTGNSDDHIHLAFDSSGRVYAVTKDAHDKFAVHRRGANGGWTTKTDVAGGSGTRPIIMVAEQDSKVYVVYTRWGVSPHRTEYRVANIADLSFGGQTTFITSSSNMNNVTGMKQMLPAGCLIAAAENGSKCLYNSFGAPPVGGPQPPTAPVNLTASLQAGPARVELAWSQPSSGAPDGYNVYRKVDSSSFQKLNASLVSGTSYTDNSPAAGMLCYQVTAFANALEGNPSNTACADNTPIVPAPGAPQSLTATLQGTSADSVIVLWQAPSSGTPAGYNVYRSVNGGTFTKLNSTVVNGTTYVDRNLQNGNLCYRATAVDAIAQESAPSNTDCENALPAPPTAPQNLTANLQTTPGGSATGAAAYVFDEGSGQTAADATGHGHTGQLGTASGVDTADPTWTAGISGSALRFDGTADRVLIPDAADLDFPSSFTIEAWVKRATFGSLQCVLAKGESQRRNYYMQFLANNTLLFRWETADGTNHGTTTSATITDANWHHIACVLDQTQHQDRIYFDGVLVKQATDNALPAMNNDPIVIGARPSGSLVEFFNGTLDLVRVSPGVVYASNFTPPTSFGGGPPSTVVNLAWQQPASGTPAGYNIYRQIDGGSFAKLNSSGLVSGLSYVDNAPPLGALCYRVKAVDGFTQEGAASNTACQSNPPTTSSSWPGGDPAMVERAVAAQLGTSPNPFNPSTTIQFQLHEPEHVRLAIYDVRGRCVATLLDAARATGTHRLEWNGRVQGGSIAPSGAYFAVLDAGTTHMRQKLLLLK